MSELWTTQQREWLQAMGHAVWSMGSAEALAAERQPEAQGERHRDEGAGPRGAMREAAALLAGDERASRPTAARPAAPARAPAGDRLMLALLRAAGGTDEARVKDIAGDIAALRGNAAAKRALWPRLRALRKDSRE